MKLYDVMKRFMALLLTFALLVGMVGTEALAASFSGRDDISDSENNMDEVPDHIHNQGGWKCTEEEGSKVLTCELEEHTHTAECYGEADMELVCGKEETEGHVHTEDCNPTETREIVCGLEETEGHTHTDECYTTKTVLTCEIPEDHHHTIDCYKLSDNDMGLGTEMQIDGEWYLVEKLICEIPEGHLHGDDCYTTETTLICELEETEGHTHTDECYTVTTTYDCGLEESEGHTHSEECYAAGKGELICGKEEHTHTDECYTITEGAWTCTPPAVESEVTDYSDQYPLSFNVGAGHHVANFGADTLANMARTLGIVIPTDGVWASSDERVISMTEDGAMTVNTENGSCVITYTYDDGAKIAQWTVVIGEEVAENVWPSNADLKGWASGGFWYTGQKLYVGTQSYYTSKGAIQVYCLQHGNTLYRSSPTDLFAVFTAESSNAKKAGISPSSWYMGEGYCKSNGQFWSDTQRYMIGLILNNGSDMARQAYLWQYNNDNSEGPEKRASLYRELLPGNEEGNYDSIEKAVNRYLNYPSFFNGVTGNGKTYTYNGGREQNWPNGQLILEIPDTKNVLDESFTISVNPPVVNASIVGGNNPVIKLTATEVPTMDFTVTVSKTDAIKTYTVYHSDHIYKNKYTKVNGYTPQDIVKPEGSDTISVSGSFTVKATPQKGRLTITKAVVGGGSEAENKTFTFTVTGPNDYRTTQTITGNGSVTINDLTPGNYTVTEADANIEHYTWVSSGSGGVNVAAASNTNITITNTYTEKPGSLTITKAIDYTGSEPEVANAKTYTFTVTGPSYPSGTTVTISGNGTAKLDDLIPGIYTVQEQDASIPGYSLTVVGEGGVTVNKDADTPLTITNTYVASEVSVSPQVSKTVIGPNPTKEEFTFNLIDGTSKIVGTVDVPSDGTWKQFDPLTFNKAGTYKYTISEVEGSKPGYSYSKDEWEVTVTVVAKNTALNATVTYQKAGDSTTNEVGATFTNDYKVTAHTKYTPQVNKAIEGYPPQDSTFTFKIKDYSFVPKYSNKLSEQDKTNAYTMGTAEAKVTGAGTASFGEITFNQAGTFTCTIIEENTGIAGYTYDPTEWKLEVVVDDVNSVLCVSSHTYTALGKSSDDEASFINKYEPKETGAAPKVAKVITGDERTNSKKQFEFTLGVYGNNPEGGAVLPKDTTISILDQNEGSFGNVTFKRAGTYQFIIKEEDTHEEGYTYDKNAWVWTVVAVDENAVLRIDSATYTKYEPKMFSASGDLVKTSITDEKATFENTYKVKPTEYTPVVTKQVTGQTRPLEKYFGFTLEALDTKPNGFEIKGATDISILGLENGDIAEGKFAPIEFTKAGTYKFLIKEKNGRQTGYQYDDSIFLLTVTVEDVESELVATATYTKWNSYDEYVTGEKAFGSGVNPGNSEVYNSADFVNDYQPTPTEYQPKVTKEVFGDVQPGAKYFTFTISSHEDNPQGAEMAENQSVDIFGANSPAVTTGFFEKIKFTKPGTYYFDIREVPGDDDDEGYTYDSSVWTLEVVVSDHDGVLKVDSVQYSKANTDEEAVTDPVIRGDSAKFNNEYHVKPTHIAIGIEKQIVSDTQLPQKDETFEFEMEYVSGVPNGMWIPADTVKITGSGMAKFKDIDFYKAGVYKVAVKEITGNRNGYIYDTTVWTILISVVDTNSKLEVESLTYSKSNTGRDNFAPERSITDPNELDTTAAIFVNRYDVTPGELNIRVKKNLNGDPIPDPSQKFVFNLELIYESNVNAVEISNPLATIEGANSGYFEPIKFTKPGTFRFAISEVKEDIPGFAYSEAVWNVEVVVTDIDGVLETVYENVEGAETPKNSVRYYQVVDDAGNPIADPTDSEAVAVFTNTFKNTKLNLGIFKTVQHYVPEGTAPEFTFELKEDQNNPTGVVLTGDTRKTITVDKGAGDYETSFDEIIFNNAGTFVFVVSEVTDDRFPGYDYDEIPYIVAVVVKDLNHELTITSLNVQKDGTVITDIDHIDATEQLALRFTNTYNPLEAKYTPSVVKAISGTPTDDETFTFNIAMEGHNGNNVIMPSVPERTTTIQGAGVGYFGEIKFKRAGTYEFTITEAEGTNNHYHYDETSWTLSVEVEDIGGELRIAKTTYTPDTPDVEKSNDAAAFNNTWLTDISVRKEWVGDDPLMRPNEITVQLYRDGTVYRDPVTLNAANDWAHTWSELDDGHDYSVAEVNVPDGYSMTVEPEGDTAFVITNTYQPDVTPSPTPSDNPTPENTPAPSEQPSEQPIPTPNNTTPETPNNPNTPNNPTPDNPNTPENPAEEQQDYPEQNDTPNYPNVPNAPENQPNMDLPNEDVPLADVDVPKTPDTPIVPNNPSIPEEEPGLDLPDNDVPLADMPPQTGEAIMNMVWMSLMIGSGTGLLVTAKGKKREEEE